jgi:WD40 repeat protein
MALQVSACKKLAVSGQVGPSPAVFVWDAATGQKKARAKLAKGARGVNAIAISADNSLFAVVDLNDSHNVYLFDAASGQMKGQEKGDTNKIFDVAFSQKPGDNSFCTVGSKHCKFWETTMAVKKGIFGGKGEATSFACVAYDDKGTAYTGAVNSQIYVWPSNNLASTIPAHKGGFICAMKWSCGKLYSGGKDGNIVITNTESLTVENTISFDGVLIRAIDVNGSKGLVGMRDGTIFNWDVGTTTKTVIMKGHSDGEVWGLAMGDDSTVFTSGDDNKIFCWDINTRKAKNCATISTTSRKAPRGGASSLTNLPDSQCARAVAYNHTNMHLAVGHNDGTMTVRACSNLDQVLFTNTNSTEWIEAMSYSPDGSKLAVGSHDNTIYVYDSSNYTLLGKCTAHNSFIVSVDWSCDGKFIRSCCGAHELLFHNGDTYKQDPSGASNTKDTEWATAHAKFGWLVDGIFPAGTDGTHINGVALSKDGQFIATGDDYGLVNIFRNPCRVGHNPISLRGHSEHVVRAEFHKDDSYLFSVGGYDQTLMQFKRC